MRLAGGCKAVFPRFGPLVLSACVNPRPAGYWGLVMFHVCRTVLFAACLGGFLPRVQAAIPAPPKFQEILGLVRTNLSGVSPAELDGMAVKALLQQLDGRVTLETGPRAPAPARTGPPVSKIAVFDGVFGYLRISHIGTKLDESLATEFAKLGGGQLKGLLLDLRYADGSDQKAAARTADRFLATERALLTVDGEAQRSTTKTNAIQIPTAILVNRDTSGAAELLAALLRQNQVGLLIGTATTGGIRQFKEFTLSTGQRLRIATGETKFGDGQSLPAGGLRPDIAVDVGPEEERAFYAEPFPTAGKSTASKTPGRINEAELVRRLNAGQKLDEHPSPAPPALTTPQVRDPALARALDLLKGLAIVQTAKP